MKKGILIAGSSSGCGKTSITLAILKALHKRGLSVSGFKCGPDYIDPMYHRLITGRPSYNLDICMMGEEAVLEEYERRSADSDIAVIEGVMGYYDGLGMTERGSAFHLAQLLELSVLLIVPCRGMSSSIEALIEGFLHHRELSHIEAVIFRELPEKLYPHMEAWCLERGIRPLGIFPTIKEAALDSRHLGLLTPIGPDGLPQPDADLSRKLDLLSQALEDLPGWQSFLSGFSKDQSPAEGGVEHGRDQSPAEGDVQAWSSPVDSLEAPAMIASSHPIIAVARDEAFCFYYEANLEALEAAGARLLYFSPLHDDLLPEGTAGLYIGGGYPELYAVALSEKTGLMAMIRDLAEDGAPIHAECGGYMYLHTRLLDQAGDRHALVGLFPGECRYTGRLQRFGYVRMRAQADSILGPAGTVLIGHEFHRCVSDLEEGGFHTVKLSDYVAAGQEDGGYYSYVFYKNVAAGFPHIHYAGLSLEKFISDARHRS